MEDYSDPSRDRESGASVPYVSRKGALLLTPRQAAETLAISERKLWSLKASGEIPHVRVGRLVRYPVDGLRRWVEEQTTGGEAK